MLATRGCYRICVVSPNLTKIENLRVEVSSGAVIKALNSCGSAKTRLNRMRQVPPGSGLGTLEVLAVVAGASNLLATLPTYT